MNPSDPLRVFVFDSDDAVREELTSRLLQIGCRVESIPRLSSLAEKSQEGPACIVGYSLELISLDIQLPFEVVGEPPSEAAIVMAASIVNDVLSICQGGGIAFLVPPFTDEELKEAMEKIVRVDDLHLQNNAFKSETLNKVAALAERERQVLEMIFDGMMNKNIARRLNVSLRTVEADRAGIFEKFGAESAVDLVRVLCDAGFETEKSCDARLAEEEQAGDL